MIKPAVAQYVDRFRTLVAGLDDYVKQRPDASLDEVKRMAREINESQKRSTAK
jgi:hypothetical protein